MVKNLIKILNFSITLSMVFFLITLLIVYIFLENPVSIWFASDDSSTIQITHNEFFYGFLLVFFMLQMIFYIFSRLVIDKKFSSGNALYISMWFRGMAIAINMFFILMIIVTGLVNHSREYPFTKIILPAYTGPALLILWLILFPVFIWKSRQTGQGIT